MKTKLIFVPILLFCSSIFFLGCFGVDSSFSEIKNDIVSTTGIQFNKDIEFGIGSAGLSLASAFIGKGSDEEDTREIIRHLSKVQVGVYKKYQPVSRQAAIQLLRNIDNRMQDGGWRYIVRSYESGEVSTIYVKMTEDYKLHEMFVVCLSKDELAIVNLRGDLDKVISIVIKDKKMDLAVND